MRAKDCSPGNVAEGFFGSLKNMFSGYHDWKSVAYEQFRERFITCLARYNETCIKKKSLKWQRPMQYRRSLRLTTCPSKKTDTLPLKITIKY